MKLKHDLSPIQFSILARMYAGAVLRLMGGHEYLRSPIRNDYDEDVSGADWRELEALGLIEIRVNGTEVVDRYITSEAVALLDQCRADSQRHLRLEAA